MLSNVRSESESESSCNYSIQNVNSFTILGTTTNQDQSL